MVGGRVVEWYCFANNVGVGCRVNAVSSLSVRARGPPGKVLGGVNAKKCNHRLEHNPLNPVEGGGREMVESSL